MELTPKEKAKELVEKFSDLEEGEMYIGKAKQCALIAVDEILEATPHSPSLPLELMPHFSAMKYWKEVKEELLKIQ